MALSISSSLIACRRVFNELIEDIQGVRDGNLEGLCIKDWEDERGRLRMWAANIGAHQIGQSSLEFRLRDSSHIRQQIIKLLNELLHRLNDGRAIIANGEDSDIESIHSLGSSENEAPRTETQQLRKNIATIINCLFEMSILVRKPARHDIRVGSTQDEMTDYEWVDQRHVTDKFPNADGNLALRLARAITQRRRYLKYRERHAAKLRQGIDHGAPGALHSGSEVLSETVATNIRNWNLDFDDKASDSGFTQTSYASTLLSGDHLTIPAPPRASHDGAPFECPYCFFVIMIRSRTAWNRHVFHDLQPYVCIDINCVTPNKLYPTRHDWSNHLRTMHPHKELLQAGTGKQIARHNCPLCGDAQSTQERYDRHVAHHLQELALFVLPRNNDDSNDGESDVELGTRYSRGTSLLVNSETSSDRRKRLPGEAVPDPGPVGRGSQDRHNGDEFSVIADFGVEGKIMEVPDKINEGQPLPTIYPAPVWPSGNRTKRQRTTPGEATHECKICGKLFKRAYNYKSHMETHNPDRKFPHYCTAMVGDTPCTKKFLRKGDLDRHYDSVSALAVTRDEGRNFSLSSRFMSEDGITSVRSAAIGSLARKHSGGIQRTDARGSSAALRRRMLGR